MLKKLAETGAVGPNRRTIPVCLVFFRRSSCFAAGVSATVCRPTQQQITGMNTIILRQVNFLFCGFVSTKFDPGYEPFETFVSLN